MWPNQLLGSGELRNIKRPESSQKTTVDVDDRDIFSLVETKSFQMKSNRQQSRQDFTKTFLQVSKTGRPEQNKMS